MKRLKVCIAIILILVSIVVINRNIQVFADEPIVKTADSYIVMDSNGKILLSHNPEDKKEVASICKLMTTLITLENIESGNISLQDKFLTSTYASDAEGSQAFLDDGSEYTVEDLLKSVIVASANDSAIVLAEGIGGNEKNFVSLMNDRAKELGMTNTRYANSTGLPAIEQYSTAVDTAKLLSEVSKYKLYQDDCQVWMDTLTHPSGRKTELVNTNRLIKYFPYCKTGKTGFTDEAGYCLASTSVKDNLSLTCVVLGCDSPSSRFSESIELYNYAYANFANELVVSTNDEPVGVKVIRGKSDIVNVRPSEDFYLTTSKIDSNNYQIEYRLPESVSAPINIGDKVGYALIIVDGVVEGEVDLIAVEMIEKGGYLDSLHEIIEKFPIL